MFFDVRLSENENSDASEYQDELSKAQEITVVSEDTSKITRTITKDKDLKKFVNALDLEHWKLGELPDDAKRQEHLDSHRRKPLNLGKQNQMRNYMMYVKSRCMISRILIWKWEISIWCFR